MRKRYHTISGDHDDLSWLVQQDLDRKAQRATARHAVRGAILARADIMCKARQVAAAEAAAEEEAAAGRQAAERAHFAVKMLEQMQ